MSFDNNLQSTARRLTDPINNPPARVPADLRPRVLNALPETGKNSWAKRALTPAFLAGGIVAFFGVAHLLGHRSKALSQREKDALPPTIHIKIAPRPGDPIIAAVRAAVSHVSTVHLVGEESQQTPGLRKQRREIWWQRQPYFYREQCGDNTIIDDGVWQTTVTGGALDAPLKTVSPRIAIIEKSFHPYNDYHPPFYVAAIDRMDGLLMTGVLSYGLDGLTLPDSPYVPELDKINKANADAHIVYLKNVNLPKNTIDLEPHKSRVQIPPFVHGASAPMTMIEDAPADATRVPSEVLYDGTEQYGTLTEDTFQKSPNTLRLQRRRTMHKPMGRTDLPWHENAVDTVRIEVDPSTNLLRRFESIVDRNPVKRSAFVDHQTSPQENYTAKYTAEYNKPVPISVRSLLTTANTLTLGAGAPPSHYSYTITSTERDQQGNFHLRFHPNGVLGDVVKSPQFGRISSVSCVAMDAAGQTYVQVNPVVKKKDLEDVYLTPLEPAKTQTTPSKSLTVYIFVSIQTRDFYGNYNSKSSPVSAAETTEDIRQTSVKAFTSDSRTTSYDSFQEECDAARAYWYYFLASSIIVANPTVIHKSVVIDNSGRVADLGVSQAVVTLYQAGSAASLVAASEDEKRKLREWGVYWFNAAAQKALQHEAKGRARIYSTQANRLLNMKPKP